jgi:hypothetical protein
MKAKTVRASPLLRNCRVNAPVKEHASSSHVLVVSEEESRGSLAKKMLAVKSVKPLQVSRVTDSLVSSASMNLCVQVRG